MDLARSCSKRPAKFFTDSGIEIPIKWYRAPVGAKFFPVPHKWGHLDWYSSPWDTSGVGEVYEAQQKWSNGATPAGVTGQHFHGPIEYFQNGCPFDPTHFTPRNNFGVASACTGAPPTPPPIAVNLCGLGTVWLSQTLRWKFITAHEFPNDCELSGDFDIPIVYDPFNGDWTGTHDSPPTIFWSITHVEVRFSPTENDGTLEMQNWTISKIGEPDCIHLINFRQLTNLCGAGWMGSNPFFARSQDDAYFSMCTVFPPCLYRWYVSDPADD